MTNAETAYITTDLELVSSASLKAIVDALCDRVHVHQNEWVGDRYRVALGFPDIDPITPEDAVSTYCALLEQLDDSSRQHILSAERAVVNIAFEGGLAPNYKAFELSKMLLRRLTTLGLGVAITIYRAGFYHS